MSESQRVQYRFGPSISSTIFQFIAAFFVAAYFSLNYLIGRDDFITLAFLVLSILYMGQLVLLRIKPPMLIFKDEGISIPKNLLKYSSNTFSFDSIKDVKFEKNWYIKPVLKIIRDEEAPLEVRKHQLSAEDFFDIYNKIETRIGRPVTKSFEEFAKEHRREKNVKMLLDILIFGLMIGLYALAIKHYSIIPSRAKFLLFIYLLTGHFILNLVTKRIRNPRPQTVRP